MLFLVHTSTGPNPATSLVLQGDLWSGLAGLPSCGQSKCPLCCSTRSGTSPSPNYVGLQSPGRKADSSPETLHSVGVTAAAASWRLDRPHVLFQSQDRVLNVLWVPLCLCFLWQRITGWDCCLLFLVLSQSLKLNKALLNRVLLFTFNNKAHYNTTEVQVSLKNLKCDMRKSWCHWGSHCSWGEKSKAQYF